MTPKEKATQLIEKFKDHVNPYIGSGMLSNTLDEAAILMQSKSCALITTDHVLKTIRNMDIQDIHVQWELMFWLDVKTNIENLTP